MAAFSLGHGAFRLDPDEMLAFIRYDNRIQLAASILQDQSATRIRATLTLTTFAVVSDEAVARDPSALLQAARHALRGPEAVLDFFDRKRVQPWPTRRVEVWRKWARR